MTVEHRLPTLRDPDLLERTTPQDAPEQVVHQPIRAKPDPGKIIHTETTNSLLRLSPNGFRSPTKPRDFSKYASASPHSPRSQTTMPRLFRETTTP